MSQGLLAKLLEGEKTRVRLGLDVHGVLDKNFEFFKYLAQVIRGAGGKVYLITGESDTPALRAQLGDEVFWDYIVSIQDELLKTTKPIRYNRYGRPVFSDVIWDSFKGRYCAKEKITLHIDNTLRYKKYFSTPFLLYS